MLTKQTSSIPKKDIDSEQAKLNSRLIEAFESFNFKKCRRLIELERAEAKVLNRLSIPYFYLNSAFAYADNDIIHAFNALVPFLDQVILNKKNAEGDTLFQYAIKKKQVKMMQAIRANHQKTTSILQATACDLLHDSDSRQVHFIDRATYTKDKEIVLRRLKALCLTPPPIQKNQPPKARI